VVIAGQWLAGTTGVDFLNACHQLDPAAKRLILIAYGDIIAGRAAVRSDSLIITSTSRGVTRTRVGSHGFGAERDPKGFLLTDSDLSHCHWTGRRCRRKPALRVSLPLVTCGTAPLSAASAVGEGAAAIQQVHHYLATS
jgi:hypothetical protein